MTNQNSILLNNLIPENKTPNNVNDLGDFTAIGNKLEKDDLDVAGNRKVISIIIGMVTKVIAPGYAFFISVVYVKFLLNTETLLETLFEFIFVLSPLLLYLMVAILYLERESRLLMANWFRNKGIIIRFAETTFRQYFSSFESLSLLSVFVYYTGYIWYYSHSSIVGVSTYLLVLTPIVTWFLLGYEYCDLNSKTEPISKVYENNLIVSFPGEIESFACEIHEFNLSNKEYQRLIKLKRSKWNPDDFESWDRVQAEKNKKFDSYQFGIKKPDIIKVYRRMGFSMIRDDYLTSKDKNLFTYGRVIRYIYIIMGITCLLTEIYGLTRDYDACG